MRWVDEPSTEVSESASGLVESFLEALPRLGVALTIIVVGYVLSRLLRWATAAIFRRSHAESFARVMSKLLSWVALFVVILLAVTVTFPSVKPVDLLAGLGFFSVAAGFAFQDVLENTLSGVLLLFREPFHSGDQVIVGESEGTVEAITIRETRIRTFDGQLVVVPNKDVYMNAIQVKTDADLRRISFVVGVAYEADLDEVQRLIEDVVADLDEVSKEKRVDALVTNLGVSTIDFDVRFWVDSRQYETKVATDAAIRATKRALDEAGVEMPSDIVALQATSSFRSALHDRPVTPGGSDAA